MSHVIAGSSGSLLGWSFGWRTEKGVQEWSKKRCPVINHQGVSRNLTNHFNVLWLIVEKNYIYLLTPFIYDVLFESTIIDIPGKYTEKMTDNQQLLKVLTELIIVAYDLVIPPSYLRFEWIWALTKYKWTNLSKRGQCHVAQHPVVKNGAPLLNVN